MWSCPGLNPICATNFSTIALTLCFSLEVCGPSPLIPLHNLQWVALCCLSNTALFRDAKACFAGDTYKNTSFRAI